MNIMLKVSALILIIAGSMLAYKPDFINYSPEKLTGYEMIEKRVKWGFLIGLGIFFVFNTHWDKLGLTIWALLAALTFGVIIARVLGFILDGLFAKQMLWLLIELVLAVVFSILYWRLKITY